MKKEVTVIGAGLVGPLLAILLSRQGYNVSIYDHRKDPRKEAGASLRSINLALSERGIEALKRAGVADHLQSMLTPMFGREIHTADGMLSFQPYGKADQCIYSV